MKHEDTFTASETTGHEGPIPGGREANTLTHSEPGSIGGGIAGERTQPATESIAMSKELRHELEVEGGGS